MKAIETTEDIKLLVDSFYTKVRNDTLLGPIFNNTIQDKWSEHLDKMYRFWGTVLLETHNYIGSPFTPHIKLNIEKEHFSIWLELFVETIDTNFNGEKAMEAKWRAAKMAEMFALKLNYYKNSDSKPIV